MRPQHITYEKCPACNKSITGLRIDHRHSNGHWNEYVDFECGSQHHFSPNFECISIIKSCPTECALIHINFLLKTSIECTPKVVLDDVDLKAIDDARWHWNYIFKLPDGCEFKDARIVKQVKQKPSPER